MLSRRETISSSLASLEGTPDQLKGRATDNENIGLSLLPRVVACPYRCTSIQSALKYNAFLPINAHTCVCVQTLYMQCHIDKESDTRPDHALTVISPSINALLADPEACKACSDATCVQVSLERLPQKMHSYLQ